MAVACQLDAEDALALVEERLSAASWLLGQALNAAPAGAPGGLWAPLLASRDVVEAAIADAARAGRSS